MANLPLFAFSAYSAVNDRITAYTLPPDKLAQAHALYLIEIGLYFATALYGFAILWFILRWRWAARFRDLAERLSSNRFVQAFIVGPLFIAVISALLLPPEMYAHHVVLKYGLSVQGWASWFRDWGVRLLLYCLAGSFVAGILYSIISRSPRRAWLYFWLAFVPIAGFVTFIAPVAVDPLFNRFTPLQNTHPEIVRDLQQVARRARLRISAERMYEMNAGVKYTGANAYVTGFGASKRVVVWDTAIRQMSTPELMFTFGHELGHYVLGHVVEGYMVAMAYCFALFYLTSRIARSTIARWGPSLQIRELQDWASLPLLTFIGSVLLFFSTPGLNAFSRHIEHDADIYGLEVVHGLVPDSSQVAAYSFQHLGEEWLEYPHVSEFAEIWLWNHPTNAERVRFAATYDPWQPGHSPKFVK